MQEIKEKTKKEALQAIEEQPHDLEMLKRKGEDFQNRA